MSRVAIIGAGIAGLQAARRIGEAGHEVKLFEKARGPGGRMSTRRTDDGTFDHGAQYFTARSERFQLQVEAWRARGTVAPWKGRIVRLSSGKAEVEADAPMRFVGTPKMSAIGRDLLGQNEIDFSVRIASCERSGSVWKLRCDAGFEHGDYDALGIAVPPAQAVPLLESSPALAATAAGVRMWPCHALMLGFEEALPVEFDGAFLDDARISWAARNSAKPGREGRDHWVVHARSDWSESQVESPNEAVGLKMEEAFREAVGSALPTVAYRATHRWLYARTANALDVGHLFDADRRLGVCGDWCVGDRVEDGFCSGDALAETMLDSLERD